MPRSFRPTWRGTDSSDLGELGQEEAIDDFLGIYGLLALAHILLQLCFALANEARSRRSLRPSVEAFAPRVHVIVPAYNESPSVLRACVESILAQDYPDCRVWVVEDGSPSQLEVLPVLRDLALRGARVLPLSENVGKRRAQRAVLEEIRREQPADSWPDQIVVTVDSDTILHDRSAICEITRRFADEKVDAVTGDVRVENRRANLLSYLISLRYWMAFHQERAAQSLFGVMLCCSGPFSAYRLSSLLEQAERYTSQSFLGKECTFGDDRHLTNLILANGGRAVFEPRARAHTFVPTRIGEYLTQQLRWNKSFYREILWTARFAHRRNPYMAVDLALQTVLPFLLIVALAWTVRSAIVDGAHHLADYALLLAAVSALRAGYGMLRTRTLGYAAFVCYGVIHVALLMPVRFAALATMRSTGWGTRKSAGDEDASQASAPTPVPQLPVPQLPASQPQASPTPIPHPPIPRLPIAPHAVEQLAVAQLAVPEIEPIIDPGQSLQPAASQGATR